MFRQNYVILTDYDKVTDQTRIFIGKQENLDTETNEYDNSDDSLIFATNRPQMPYLLYGKSFPRPQQSYIDNGTFEAEDYAEYAELKDGVLKDILVAQALKFDYDQSDPNSGVPFRYPNWQDEKATVAQTEAEPQLPPFYKEYLTEQEKYPKAIVLTRLGDFYEMFGESAEKASDALNLTLTGRIVGVDRIPMCGVPFHATDAYIEKLIKQYPVVVLEKDKEPIYIQSHAESLAQNEEAEKPAPKLIEVDDDGDNPFDNDEQLMPDEENGDEHPDYIGEIDTRFPIDDEYDDEYAAEQNELEDEDDAAYDDENIDKEQAEEEKENRPQTKPKQSKPIQSRKRKEKPQLSFFDMLDGKTQEKTPQEQLIEYGLKIGSGVHQGKFRIYDKYKENPTVEDFADFLKKEYGVGGGGYELEVWHDAKGLRLKQRDKSGNEILEIITTSQLHALIVGTTGSGKTTGFVDQNISVLARSCGKPSLVISDPKKELYEKHANHLAMSIPNVGSFGNSVFTIFMIVGGAMVIPAGQTLFARLFGTADDMHAGGGWLRSAY